MAMANNQDGTLINAIECTYDFDGKTYFWS